MEANVKSVLNRIASIAIVLMSIGLLGLAPAVLFSRSQTSGIYVRVNLAREIGTYFNALAPPIVGLVAIFVLSSAATMIILSRHPVKSLKRFLIAAAMAAISSFIVSVFSCVYYSGIISSSPPPEMFLIWVPIMFAGNLAIAVVGLVSAEGIVVLLEKPLGLRNLTFFIVPSAIALVLAVYGIAYAYLFINAGGQDGYSPTVSGRMLDGVTGKPMSGATVKVEWLGMYAGSRKIYFTKTYKVNADGTFLIPGHSRKLKRESDLDHEKPGTLMLVFAAPDRRPEYSSRPIQEHPWTDAHASIVYLYPYGVEPETETIGGRKLEMRKVTP